MSCYWVSVVGSLDLTFFFLVLRLSMLWSWCVICVSWVRIVFTSLSCSSMTISLCSFSLSKAYMASSISCFLIRFSLASSILLWAFEKLDSRLSQASSRKLKPYWAPVKFIFMGFYWPKAALLSLIVAKVYLRVLIEVLKDGLLEDNKSVDLSRLRFPFWISFNLVRSKFLPLLSVRKRSINGFFEGEVCFSSLGLTRDGGCLSMNSLIFLTIILPFSPAYSNS